jgi:hypothetical protein
MKEGIFDTASKVLGATLVEALQLKIGKAVLEVIFLAVLGAPERKTVGVDGIVCSVADQAICGDILVVVKLMNDGLVEL